MYFHPGVDLWIYWFNGCLFIKLITFGMLFEAVSSEDTRNWICKAISHETYISYVYLTYSILSFSMVNCSGSSKLCSTTLTNLSPWYCCKFQIALAGSALSSKSSLLYAPFEDIVRLQKTKMTVSVVSFALRYRYYLFMQQKEWYKKNGLLEWTDEDES